VEGIRAAQQAGDDRGVRVAIEPVCRFETYYVNRAMQAFSLAEEVGPGCGIVLDVFHMYLEELDPFEAIEAASTRLINFHVAEHNRLSPGLGVVQWIDFVKVLERVQYEGYVTLEFAAPGVWPASVGSSDPYTVAVRNAAELLRRCT
jgi:sugar phosphate isomerase/epimerase